MSLIDVTGKKKSEEIANKSLGGHSLQEILEDDDRPVPNVSKHT